MSLKSMVGISLLILTVPAASLAWQPPPAARQPGVLPPPRSVPAQEQSLPGTPREYPSGAPTAPGYQVPQAQGYSNGNQPDYPQYPYPPYRNPYFEGYSARNFVSNAIDWIVTLPSNVFDHFSNYLDGTIFPRAPATHGRSAQPASSAPSQPRPIPSNEPLPPASVYNPGE